MTPTTNFTEHTVMTAALYNPTINCDIVAEYNNTRVKAIAYSETPNSTTILPQAYLYADDGYGHSATITLPTGSDNPDVAMACRDNGPTSPLLYQAVVTYTVGNVLYIEVYDLSNVGYSTFALASSPTYQKTISGVYQFSHIDMWVDGYSVPYLTNLWSLHQFAVVYSTGPAAQLKAYVNDVASWAGTAAPFIIPNAAGTSGVYNALMPDVACQLDASGNKAMHIAFENGTSPYYDNTNATGLTEVSYDYTAGTTTSGPNSLVSGRVYAPRIEAIGDFSTGIATENPIYEIACSLKQATSGVYDQVRGYNLIAGPHNISSLDFGSPYSCMSACVAAGPTVNNSLYPNIGNVQYTIGFYPWTTGTSGVSGGHVYERQVDFAGGYPNSSNTTYQASTTPVLFYWDLNRNMAVSNTSNYGADILSAWYNGTDVVWKLSTPDVMAFRMIHAGGGVEPEVKLNIAPNPATDALSIAGLTGESSYLITDVAGRCVKRGAATTGYSISVASLPNGSYTMRVMQSGKDAQTFPFIKQ